MVFILTMTTILAASWLIGKSLCRSVVNPYTVLVSMISLQSGLYIANLAHYEPLSSYAQVMIVFMLLSASVGFLTALMAFQSAGVNYNNISMDYVKCINVRGLEVLLKAISLILLILIFVFGYRTLSLIKGNPLGYFASAMEYRNEVMFGELAEARGKYFPLLIQVAYTLSCIFAPIHLIITKRHRYFHSAPLIGAVIYAIIMMSRTHVVDAFFVYLASMWIFGRAISSAYAERIIKHALMILVIFFLAYTYFVTDITGKLDWSAKNEHLYIDDSPFLAQMYDYFTISLSKFNDVMERDAPQYSMGWSTFRPMAYLLYKFGILQYYSDTEFLFEDYWLPFYGNVSPAIRFFFEDYGVLGIIIIPYLFMLLSGFVFVANRVSFSPIRHVSLVLLLYCSFASTGVWIFWYQHYYLVIIISGFIGGHILSRKHCHIPHPSRYSK